MHVCFLRTIRRRCIPWSPALLAGVSKHKTGFLVRSSTICYSAEPYFVLGTHCSFESPWKMARSLASQQKSSTASSLYRGNVDNLGHSNRHARTYLFCLLRRRSDCLLCVSFPYPMGVETHHHDLHLLRLEVWGSSARTHVIWICTHGTEIQTPNGHPTRSPCQSRARTSKEDTTAGCPSSTRK